MGAGPVTLYAQWQNPAGMVRIDAKGKTFSMGSTNGYENESPVHQVTFTKDFWMDTTEVTQGEYETLMKKMYSGFTAPSWESTYGVSNNHPAYYVNWYDAVLYCNARTKATGSNDTVYTYTSIEGVPGNDCELKDLSIDLTKAGFHLPTEAQWEYAYRAGTTTDFYWGKIYDPYPTSAADTTEIDGYVVWYGNSYSKGSGNTGFGTHPVATKKKNGFGLYDMSGNVWEWCNDWHGDYSSEAQIDPIGPETSYSRVLRGGSWYDSTIICLRSAFRGLQNPIGEGISVGFRVCLPAQ